MLYLDEQMGGFPEVVLGFPNFNFAGKGGILKNCHEKVSQLDA
jgi:hypothetical protein